LARQIAISGSVLTGLIGSGGLGIVA